MGPCTREYGLMLDSMREMEVVTSEGDILRINKEQHADLFWV
jgi:FAD/FMN-containing dehydrogenase